MVKIEEIYQRLLDGFAARAGFTPDDACELSVRLYAVAAELQALAVQGDWVLNQSFPQTAQGIYLERHAAMRGLKRSAATKAVGVMRFAVDTAATAPLVIPKGTVCLTAEDVRFETDGEASLAVGALTVEVPATCLSAGLSGNAAAGTITLLAALPAGILRCTNPAAFTGGCDAESDESLRSRVEDSYHRLPNGANAAFYEQVAMGFPEVAAAVAVGRARGVGTVDVCVATAAGLPGQALLDSIRTVLQKKREIAVDVQVLAPTVVKVPVTVALSVAEGYSLQEAKDAVTAALGVYFTGKRLGKPVLLAELNRLLYDAAGVANYRLTAPASDLAANATVLPQLGTLTLTAMGG
ncbi:MAG: baseplate J/gp47 family protein [Oscillospiraceae bacterium]